MARKKIIFVIVEGPSDDTALGAILSNVFSSDKVHVHITHGDITTRYRVTANNVVAKVADEVRSYAVNNHCDKAKKTFFKEIIHIIDTDGAYISDDNIVHDDSALKIKYSETEIRTKSKTDVAKRNKQKRENINKLLTKKEILGLPYRVFYMSCNIDHVLYNRLNISDKEKEDYSLEFAKKYKDNIADFLVFVSDSDFSVTTNYNDSWNYIKEDSRSLERHTNLGLWFADEPN